MKISVTFKDPDCVYEAINDAMRSEHAALLVQGLTHAEADAVIGLRRESAHEACGRHFAHGEYVTVEVDTEKGTATVVETK
jgi:hypothetical protein